VCPCQCHRLPTERFRIGGVRGGRVEVEVVGGDVVTVTLDQLDAIVGAHVAADEVVMARRRATTYALA